MCSSDLILYEKDGMCGLSFYTGLKVALSGGQYQVRKEGIEIQGADEIVLYLNIATNFVNSQIAPIHSKVDEKALCLNNLSTLKAHMEPQLYSRHREDYKSLYQRVHFELEGMAEAELPTDERLKRGGEDVMLPVLLFNYGRYLLIASSREGTQPANLQGIWNEKLRAPWSSN